MATFDDYKSIILIIVNIGCFRNCAPLLWQALHRDPRESCKWLRNTVWGKKLSFKHIIILCPFFFRSSCMYKTLFIFIVYTLISLQSQFVYDNENDCTAVMKCLTKHATFSGNIEYVGNLQWTGTRSAQSCRKQKGRS